MGGEGERLFSLLSRSQDSLFGETKKNRAMSRGLVFGEMVRMEPAIYLSKHIALAGGGDLQSQMANGVRLCAAAACHSSTTINTTHDKNKQRCYFT